MKLFQIFFVRLDLLVDFTQSKPMADCGETESIDGQANQQIFILHNSYFVIRRSPPAFVADRVVSVTQKDDEGGQRYLRG